MGLVSQLATRSESMSTRWTRRAGKLFGISEQHPMLLTGAYHPGMRFFHIKIFRYKNGGVTSGKVDNFNSFVDVGGIE